MCFITLMFLLLILTWQLSEKLTMINEKLWIQKIHIYDFVVFTVETSIAINSLQSDCKPEN
jgi:hypothetical protein